MSGSAMIPARPRPYLCTWEITLACNCRCVHCGSRAGRARQRELSTAAALALIDQLAELGCRAITLSGGEPLLRRDWPQLVEAIRRRGLTAELISNGLAVAEQAAAIADAGFSAVSISIDGPAAVHERLRGQAGTLARALEGASELHARGVRLGAVTQVNRHNVDQLEEIYELVAAHGFAGWQIQLTTPHGRARDDAALCLPPARLPELERRIVALVNEAALFVQAADTIGWMSRNEPCLRAGSARADRFWASCQAGLRAVGITSDGTVRGCLSMPAYFDEGNIRQRSLASIWNDPQGFAYNRHFDVAALAGACRDCDFAALCRGGCTCLAWLAAGTTDHNPYCLRLYEGD